MRLPKIPHWPFLLGPVILFATGAAMNIIVMGLNHGQMPVNHALCSSMLEPDDWKHACMTSATHLKVIADWLVINGMGVASIGDLLMWAGSATWNYSLIVWASLMIVDRQEGK